jgi:hypothetical protein
MGTLYWFLMMFLWLPNSIFDSLKTIDGYFTVPIGWWWERIGEASGKYNSLALSLMFSWFLTFIVHVTELVAFILCFVGIP